MKVLNLLGKVLGATPTGRKVLSAGSYASLDRGAPYDAASLLIAIRGKERSNIYVSHYLQALEQHVLGPRGARVKWSNEIAQDRWDEWMESMSVDGADFGRYQRDALRRLARDGEILSVRSAVNGMLEFELRDSLSLPYTETDREGNVFAGIRFVGGKPRSYHFKDGNVSANRVTHVFRVQNPTHVRGQSWFTPVLNALDRLEEYENAFVIGTRNSAAAPVVFSVPIDAIYNESELENNLRTLKPGQIAEVPEGFQKVDLASDFNGANYAQTRSEMIAGIATGLNVSYHILASDVSGANYSSLRIGYVQDRGFFGTCQVLLERLLRPIADEWLAWASIKYEEVAFDSAYEIAHRKLDVVDESRDIAALKLAIDAGIESKRGAILERGKDPDKVFSEIEEEKSRFSEE